MNSSQTEAEVPTAVSVDITEDVLVVELADRRTVSVPLDWYPRLSHGSAAERSNRKLIGKGFGIHWPDLDEDISIEGLLAGQPSGESAASFELWLASRSRS